MRVFALVCGGVVFFCIFLRQGRPRILWERVASRWRGTSMEYLWSQLWAERRESGDSREVSPAVWLMVVFTTTGSRVGALVQSSGTLCVSGNAHRQVGQCVSLMAALVLGVCLGQRVDSDAGSWPASSVYRH